MLLSAEGLLLAPPVQSDPLEQAEHASVSAGPEASRADVAKEGESLKYQPAWDVNGLFRGMVGAQLNSAEDGTKPDSAPAEKTPANEETASVLQEDSHGQIQLELASEQRRIARQSCGCKQQRRPTTGPGDAHAANRFGLKAHRNLYRQRGMPTNPIAIVNNVRAEFLGSFSAWQPAATLSGVRLFGNAAEIDGATFTVIGGIGANSSIAQFTNLQTSLTNLRVTFDSSGGVRSNFQVQRGTVGVTADSATLFRGVSAAVTIDVRSSAGAAGLAGSFDLNNGGLRLRADQLRLGIGSALEINASGIDFSFASATPAANAVLGSIQQVSIKALELNDSSGNPVQFTMNPGAGNPALTFRTNGFTLADAALGPNTYSIDGVLQLTDLRLGLSNISLVTGTTPILSGTVQITAGSSALFPGQNTVTSTVTGLSGSYDFGRSTNGLTLRASQVSLAIGEALQVTGSNVIVYPGSGHDCHPVMPPRCSLRN